ncbi:MAG: flavodoxin-dependent (E)-4-hydroxy-3-methylbut-2-enyl-diphosphate synthase [Spirochaetes bacterium]|nr:flavodoxin-dependent (E)-4-hydroxy-3-methylbut-2-enyl-diphosphate synthase [Spirochaetota bacterium]
MRRASRAVRAGRLLIGGGFPVSVQTMWKKPLSSDALQEAAAGLRELERVGCDLVRFAVPDMASAECLGALAAESPLPLAADIHFDHRLALRCLDFSVAKIRINPGNIGEEWKVRDVVAKARDAGVCLRIGVNAGSLPHGLAAEHDVPAAMVKAAEEELAVMARLDFTEVVVSLKSSDVEQTIEANRLFASRYDYPLHVGVTEAGPLIPGIVKSALGIGGLLKEGIGDTVRVSLSASSLEEVIAGLEILRATRVRRDGVEIVSCPRCGRSSFDVQLFLEEVSDFIHGIKKPLTVAVMGCVVNGPGEAKKADIGITGAGKMAIIFKEGRAHRTVPFEEAASAFREEVEKLL